MGSARHGPLVKVVVRRLVTSFALVIIVFVGSAAAEANDATPALGMERVIPQEFSGDVRDLFLIRDSARPYRPLLAPPRSAKPRVSISEPDIPSVIIPLVPMPGPVQNFAGMSLTDNCGGVPCGSGWPSDINGDVGPNHFIEAVNTSYAIYSKTGTLLASFTENQLFSASGSNPCNGNSAGDPIVLYDQLADRWILTHFAFAVNADGDPLSPFYQCIAASKTGDPVSGGWWLYALRMDPGGAGLPPVGAFNDYGKFGIWTDCLYGAFNEFQAPMLGFVGTAFASFSRSDLYSGAALTWALGFINNAGGPFTMIPSNLLGRSAASLPPPGTPNYFVSESTTLFTFEVRTFTAGANCGAGGSLSAHTDVSQASYDFTGGDIVPQPNTPNTLDSLIDRLMQKVQYRKVGSAESLWVVHSVQSAAGSTVRPQWAQINVTGGVIATTPVQQQIYAPDTTLNRWMASLAADNQGNMAIGYSTSNGTVPNFPSIAYSGRLATDPLNVLPQTEVQLVAGQGSQTNNCGGAPCHRWGDYTSMSLDPADDCTFWYTNQYYNSQANGTSGNWQTRIGSFKFPTCAAPPQVNRDVSGDARSDIVWRHITGAVVLWQMNGASIVGDTGLGTVATSWTIQEVADFNGDGRNDILWRNTAGDVVLWLMNGSSIISDPALGNVATSWAIAEVGDFNGDGKADILWRHTSGAVYLWLMNGATIIGNIGLGTIATNWAIVEVGDFNGDGNNDILWRNTAGDLALWLMSGGSIIGNLGLGNVATTWIVAAVGDLNGDRKADILWRNTTSGEVVLWLMNGGTIVDDPSLGTVDTSWTIQNVGDFNRDGKNDILWRHISGVVYLWLMDGPTIIGNLGVAAVHNEWTIQ